MYIVYTILLQNEEVCGNTIYSLERSEWSKSHYSPKPKAEVNNDLFSTVQIILIRTVLVLFAHGQDDIISIIILICTANRARNTFYQTGITPSRGG